MKHRINKPGERLNVVSDDAPGRSDNLRTLAVLLLLLGAMPVGGAIAVDQSSDRSRNNTERPKPVFPTQSASGKVSLAIVPGGPLMQFRYDWSAQKLFVYRPGSVEPDQILRLDTTEPTASGNGLSAIDYDGDGYLDLRVVDWWGTGGVGYEVFLYHSDTGLFAHSPLYSGLSNPRPDGTGCAISGGSAGHAGNIYSVGYYCPKDQRMQARWLERQDWDNERQLYVFSRKEWDADGRIRHHITEHRRRSSIIWAQELVWSDEEGCYTTTIREERDGVQVDSSGAPICHAIE